MESIRSRQTPENRAGHAARQAEEAQRLRRGVTTAPLAPQRAHSLSVSESIKIGAMMKVRFIVLSTVVIGCASSATSVHRSGPMAREAKTPIQVACDEVFLARTVEPYQ